MAIAENEQQYVNILVSSFQTAPPFSLYKTLPTS